MSWPRFREIAEMFYVKNQTVVLKSAEGGPFTKDLLSFMRLTLSGTHTKAGTLTGGVLCLETPHSLLKSIFLKLNGQTLIEISGTDLRVVSMIQNARDVLFTATVATTDVTTAFRAVYSFDFWTRLSEFARRTLLASNRYDTIEFGVVWGSELDFHSGAYATTHQIDAVTKLEVETEAFTGIAEFQAKVDSNKDSQTYGQVLPVKYWHRKFRKVTFDITATAKLKEFAIPVGEVLARLYLKEYTDSGVSFEIPVSNVIDAQGNIEVWFNGTERKFQLVKDKIRELGVDMYQLGLGTAGSAFPTGYTVIDFMWDRDMQNAMRLDAGSGVAELALKADVTTATAAHLRVLMETFVPSL